MIQIVFYVPESHLEPVKQAMFDVGAGRVGDYEHCAWQTAGEGQFRPTEGAAPYLGSIGEVERVAEFKVEMVCEAQVLRRVIEALRSAHPYEEPAFSYWEINRLDL